MNDAVGLTAEVILAESARLLGGADYAVVRELALERLRPERTLLAEDRYAVVLLVVCDTWAELEHGWPEAEASLDRLMSDRLTKSDPKAWEGYLALLTPEFVGPTADEMAETIRLDTSRIRKLVSTGDELQTISDVERTLLPLLPIDPSRIYAATSDVLSHLPRLLAERDVDRGAVEALVDAFSSSKPLLEQLRTYLETRR